MLPSPHPWCRTKNLELALSEKETSPKSSPNRDQNRFTAFICERNETNEKKKKLGFSSTNWTSYLKCFITLSQLHCDGDFFLSHPTNPFKSAFSSPISTSPFPIPQVCSVEITRIRDELAIICRLLRHGLKPLECLCSESFHARQLLIISTATCPYPS